MIEKLINEIEEKYNQLNEELSDPEALSDRQHYAELAKAHSDLQPAYGLVRQYREAEASMAEAEELLSTDGDMEPEMREFLKEEIRSAREATERLTE